MAVVSTSAAPADEIVRGYTGSYFPLAINTKCGSGSVPVPWRFRRERAPRQAVLDSPAVRFERAVLQVLQARHQPLIGNSPDLPGCAVWLPAFQWRCAGRASRSHPARSESRNSRLLCGKCSTACEKVSPQVRRCPLGPRAIPPQRFSRWASGFGMAPNRRESEALQKFGPQNHYRRFYPRPARIAYTITWARSARCSHWSRLEVGSPAGVILAGQ